MAWENWANPKGQRAVLSPRCWNCTSPGSGLLLLNSWGTPRLAYLQLFHNHEAEKPVETTQAKGAQCVLDFGKEAAVGHFLVRSQIVPGVQGVNVAGASARGKEDGEASMKLLCLSPYLSHVSSPLPHNSGG